MKNAQAPVLCIGEILWDSLPHGMFPGGAPFNVAAHLHMLGIPAAIASRVGNDPPGTLLRERIREMGITDELLQSDETSPTGMVHVTLDDRGTPSYKIVDPSAWDFLALDPKLRFCAAEAPAIVFGSLAQRNPAARETIRTLLATKTIRVFDLNLRPPHDQEEVVRFGLSHADIVKLNDGELARLAGWYGLPPDPKEAAALLAGKFGFTTLCVTRGAGGAALWRGGTWTDHPGFTVDVRDTVGSGDAFLAALIAGILTGEKDADLLARANALGALVASRDGATPAHDPEAIERILRTKQ